MNDSTLVLTESKSARADKMANVTHDSAMNALCKAKALVMAMWQGTGVATSQQMADYYEVPLDTIRSVSSRHKDEFDLDGLREIRGKELKALHSQGSDTMQLPEKTTRLTIWTPRAALRLGMLLRDSEVAKQVRTVLLDVAMQVPQQNDRIRELELANENMKLMLEWANRQDNRIALHGLPVALMLEGKADAVVEVEKPVIEVIDDRHNQQTKYKGMTCAQLKEYMKTRYGLNFASGANIQRVLEEVERKTGISLLGNMPRSVPTFFIPEENTEKAIEYLRNPEVRQMLLGQ